MPLLSVLLALCMMLVAVPARADSHVQARLIADRSPLAAGSTGTFALEIKVDDGWHAQSSAPHDKYLIATKVTTAAVDGLTFGAVRYPMGADIPAPAGSETSTISTYAGTVYILIPWTLAPDAAAGARSIDVTLNVQCCDDQSCLPPEKIKVSLPVTVAAAGATETKQEAAVFATALAQKFVEAAVTTQPATAPTAVTPQVTPQGVTPTAAPIAASEDADAALIASRPYAPAETPGQSGEQSLLSTLALALLGGMILNVMPCVLPVVPLKVLSLVQHAHGDKRLALLHGLVFSAGVITLFVGLGIVLNLTRSVYGGQFQSPAIVLTSAYVVLAAALAMLGIWTLNPPQAVYAVDQPRGGFAGSYASGLLVTLLATPCSGPFLGTTIPYALSHSAAVTALVFLTIGVGMSLPYVILAVFPAGLDRLPRAGRWTELVKQGVGIAMIGVALYLVLLLPAEVWPWALTGGIILSFVCWGWGQIPTYSMAAGTIWTIRTVTVLLGLAAGWGVYQFANRPPTQGWQPFSIAALDAGLKQGRPVVVDWTAAWCINCKAVEARSLNNTDVRAAFASHNALLLRADITYGSPAAEALLGKLGSRAIPVLAVFSAAEPYKPAVLRDLYSASAVLNALGTKPGVVQQAAR